MNKNRLEAFSDGVFAVVITLMVFDLKIPKTDYAHLWDALLALWPKILTYTYSFVIIGVYWVSHHSISRRIVKIDGTVIWGNILLLLCVCFIPFSTSLIGEYPFRLMPVLLYGVSLLLANLAGYFVWAYVSWCHRLIDPATSKAEVRGVNKSFLFVNLFYVVAMGVAFFSVYLSYIIFLAVVVYIIIFRSGARSVQ